MSIRIREEADRDKTAVFALNTAAFPTDAEAKLVDALRLSADPFISLVAVENQDIVGHIMFTPVTLESCDDLELMGLGPMAVAPSMQRRGIGARMIEAGLQRCRDLGTGAVAVLGHAEYYPRFGFRPSTGWNIRSEYDAPEEAFLLLELSADYLKNREGVIRYNEAFAGA